MDSKPKGSNNQNKTPDGPKRRSILTVIIAALVLTLAFNLIYTAISNSYLEEIPYSDFMTLLSKDEVDSVQFKQDRVLILTKEEAAKKSGDQTVYYTGLLPNYELNGLVDQLGSLGIDYKSEIVEDTSPLVTILVYWVLPVAGMYLLGSLLMSSVTKRMGDMGGLGSVGQSKAKVYMEK